MINEDLIIKTTAVFGKKCYNHFGISALSASLYGDKPEDIEEVKMKISKDQSLPVNETQTPADYWGWYDYKDEKFILIWHKRFLLNRCFTYGMEAEEKRNKGKAYRLEIIK